MSFSPSVPIRYLLIEAFTLPLTQEIHGGHQPSRNASSGSLLSGGKSRVYLRSFSFNAVVIISAQSAPALSISRSRKYSKSCSANHSTISLDGDAPLV